MPTLTEDQVNCPYCGEVTDVRALVDYEGEQVCEYCHDDMTNNNPCDWCGENTNKDNLNEIHDGHICNDCHGDSAMCMDCDETVHIDEVSYISTWRRDGPICEDCYDGEYFYCDGCNEHMAIGDYGGEGYCSDCFDDEDHCDCGECGYSGGGEGIRRWGDAPDLLFHDTPFIGPRQSEGTYGMTQRNYDYQPKPNTYYLGMEIELEEAQAHIIGSFVTDHSEHMWATTDATIDDGYEIVTMPHTYGAWMSTFPWEEWTDKIHGVVPNQEQHSTNGIHIHISRSAFANAKGRPMASHLYKFMQFIRINERAIQMLSGRDNSSYCEWSQTRDARDSMNDAKTATSTRNYERYRPVNTQNRQTIELRFFDGRSDPVFMKRALGFVHSVAEFTRHSKAHDKRTWEAYTAYVSANEDMYPDLQAYLVANKRRLVFNAMSSEYRYSDEVMPAIKARKQRDLNDARTERNRLTRVQREREEAMDSPTICTCSACVAYNERLARSTPLPADFLRDYMAGNFHVNVYATTDSGMRHAYTHITEPSVTGVYYMSPGFQGDVELPILVNAARREYENVTLQREAR